MKYNISFDSLAKIITAAVSILFATVIFSNVSAAANAGTVTPVAVSALLVCIYAGTFLFRPVAYVLTTDELIIERPLKNIHINRNTIKTVELLANGDLSGSIRTFAVGGLFGYYGKFANAKFGSMTWYATRRDKAVLLRTTDNRKIILTPDEAEKFAGAFNS